MHCALKRRFVYAIISCVLDGFGTCKKLRMRCVVHGHGHVWTINGHCGAWCLVQVPCPCMACQFSGAGAE